MVDRRAKDEGHERSRINYRLLGAINFISRSLSQERTSVSLGGTFLEPKSCLIKFYESRGILCDF